MSKRSSKDISKTNIKKAIKFAKKNKMAVAVIIIIAIIVVIGLITLHSTGNLNYVINFINGFFADDDIINDNLASAEGDLVIHFNDVGQGDNILIMLPDGKTLLIDGGERFNDIEEDAVSYITDRNIDTLNYVILTHTDSDHCGSLNDIIDAVTNVEKVYFPKIKTKDSQINAQIGLTSGAVIAITTEVYKDFVEEVVESTYKDGDIRKATNYEYLLNEIIIDGGNYRFTMYCVSQTYYDNMDDDSHDINDISPICVLEYAGRKIVFTGDANNSTIETSAEKRFLDAMAQKGYSSYDCDILKVAHHGGRDSSGADFLNFITCEYAIISVGEKSGDNSSGEYLGFVSKDYYEAGYTLTTSGNGAYDHPHRDIAGIPVNGEGRLAQSGVEKLYRTDLHGDTVFTISDSGEISVTTARTASVEGTVIVFTTVDIKTQYHYNKVILYIEERLRVF